MLQRKCVKIYRPLQYGNGVARFNQVENQSRHHALQKRTRCQCMRENGNSLPLYLQTKASKYVIHWFDATNFCEHNKNQSMK